MSSPPKLIRSLSTRAVKVIEKPRPLKSLSQYIKNPDAPQGFSISDVMVTVNNAAAVLEQRLVDQVYDKELLLLTDNLLNKLKIYGPRLEECFEAQLDRAFKQFRNFAYIDVVQDEPVRTNLLQLIELRATLWQPSVSATSYYMNRMMANDAAAETERFTQATENLTLSPGEVVKSSGKFAIPTRLPGKPYVKDEVVIRNADSGKVMGIKGRRVHMIEELSDTVISFQRVSPGAKERQIQITGSEEDKILIARQLIEDTIKRNASPTRENDTISNGSIYNLSDEGPIGSSCYSFTIRVGGETQVMIKGRNIETLNMAKIILDKYLSKEVNTYVSDNGLENIFPVYKDAATSTDEEEYHLSSTNTGINKCGDEPKKQAFEIKDRIADIKPKSAERNVEASYTNRIADKPKSAERNVEASYTNVDLKPKESYEKTVKDSDAHEITRTEAAESNFNSSLPDPKPITCGAPGGVRKDSTNKLSRNITTQYSKQFMLDCCSSKASQKLPADWNAMCKNFSHIVREEPLNFVAAFLESKNQSVT